MWYWVVEITSHPKSSQSDTSARKRDLFAIESLTDGPPVSQQASLVNLLAVWAFSTSQNHTFQYLSEKQSPLQKTSVLLLQKRWEPRVIEEGVVPEKYGDRRIDEERQASHICRWDYLQPMADAKSGMDEKRHVLEDADRQRQLFHLDSRYQWSRTNSLRTCPG